MDCNLPLWFLFGFFVVGPITASLYEMVAEIIREREIRKQAALRWHRQELLHDIEMAGAELEADYSDEKLLALQAMTQRYWESEQLS